jgi:hypothetical protein
MTAKIIAVPWVIGLWPVLIIETARNCANYMKLVSHGVNTVLGWAWLTLTCENGEAATA